MPARLHIQPFSGALGFSLIELLIVIGIIAVIAAIAVPNFMAARTRASVARLKADMASTAKAMEAYAVDHDAYPPISGQVRLTTPTAYIGSIPRSPFLEPAFMTEGGARRWETLPGNAPTWKLVTDSNIYDPLPLGSDGEPANERADAEQACANNCEDTVYIKYAVFPNGQGITASLLDEYAGRSQWVLMSGGPDEDDETEEIVRGMRPIGQLGVALYDPTNGTVSSGDLLMFGPGLGFMTSEASR